MEELTSGAPDEWIGSARASGRPPAGPAPLATLDLTADDLSTGGFARRGPGPDAEPGPAGGVDGPPAGHRPRPRIKFTSFVVTEADRLLGTAYLLTGDRNRAEELLRAALAGAAVRWPRSRTEPDADVLRAMARRITGPIWWRQRPNDAAPLTGDIGAGLGRLGSRQRAAVVLRYHQHRTEDETAAALGAPAGNVRSWLSQALDRLGIDTRLDLRPEAGSGLSRGGLSTELAALAAPAALAGPAAPAALGIGQNPGPEDPDPDPAGENADQAGEYEDAARLQARLADVRARLPALRRRERRRRAGIGTLIATAAVAVIAGGLALAGPVADPVLNHPAARPPAGGSAAELFDPRNRSPDRFTFVNDLAGDPLIGSVVGDRGQEEVDLRFTPGTTSLAFSDFCQIDVEDGTWLHTTLNGHDLNQGPCRTDDQADKPPYWRDAYPQVTRGGWFDLGVRRGRESVLRLRLTSSTGETLPAGRPLPKPVRIGIVVYQLSGPRVISDGVIIKGDAEADGFRYVLGGYRTARITPSRRKLSLEIPAGVGRRLVLIGMPNSTSTSDGVLPATLDRTTMVEMYGSGTVTSSLPDDGPHRIGISARPDDTGAMVLAWYESTSGP